MLTSSRRAFITGLVSLIAAPAIVRATSLMPVKVMPPAEDMNALLKLRMDEVYRITRESMVTLLYGDPDTLPVECAGFSPAWSHREMAVEISLPN